MSLSKSLPGALMISVVDMLKAKADLWLQNLTTKGPDDDMIEVGITSEVEAVFDWKASETEGV